MPEVRRHGLGADPRRARRRCATSAANSSAAQADLPCRVQLGVERVAQVGEQLHVERGVRQPGLGQRPARPVGRRVVLLQGEPEQLLGQRGQPDPLEAGQPGGQFGVEQPARAQPHLGQAGQVLAGRVQHPLGLARSPRPARCRSGSGSGSISAGAGAGPAQLHQVRALAVAVAGGAFGVQGDRAGARREAGHDLGKLGRGGHRIGGAVTRGGQRNGPAVGRVGSLARRLRLGRRRVLGCVSRKVFGGPTAQGWFVGHLPTLVRADDPAGAAGPACVGQVSTRCPFGGRTAGETKPDRTGTFHRTAGRDDESTAAGRPRGKARRS